MHHATQRDEGARVEVLHPSADSEAVGPRVPCTTATTRLHPSPRRNQSGPPNRRPIPGGAGSAGAPRNPERAGAQSRLRTPSHTGAREQWPPISIPPRGRHVPPHVEKAAAAIQTSERSSLGVLTPPELVTSLRWTPLGTTRSTGRRSTTPHAATTAAANSVPEVLRVKFQGAPPALRLHPRRPSIIPPRQV